MAPVVQVHGEACEVNLRPLWAVRVLPVESFLRLAIRRRAARPTWRAPHRLARFPPAVLRPLPSGGIFLLRLLPSPSPLPAAPGSPGVPGLPPCRVVAARRARLAPSGRRGAVHRPHVVMRPLHGPRASLLPPPVRGFTSSPRGGGVLLTLTARVRITVTRVEEICSASNALWRGAHAPPA